MLYVFMPYFNYSTTYSNYSTECSRISIKFSFVFLLHKLLNKSIIVILYWNMKHTVKKIPKRVLCESRVCDWAYTLKA